MDIDFFDALIFGSSLLFGLTFLRDIGRGSVYFLRILALLFIVPVTIYCRLYTEIKFTSGLILSLIYALYFFFKYFKDNRNSFKMNEIYKNLIEEGTGFLIIMMSITLVTIVLFGSEKVFDDSDIYFENCTDAFSKGYYNIYEHEPGYRYELDRDGDGIGCER